MIVIADVCVMRQPVNRISFFRTVVTVLVDHEMSAGRRPLGIFIVPSDLYVRRLVDCLACIVFDKIICNLVFEIVISTGLELAVRVCSLHHGCAAVHFPVTMECRAGFRIGGNGIFSVSSIRYHIAIAFNYEAIVSGVIAVFDQFIGICQRIVSI